jgi:hypothetical protein
MDSVQCLRTYQSAEYSRHWSGNTARVRLISIFECKTRNPPRELLQVTLLVKAQRLPEILMDKFTQLRENLHQLQRLLQQPTMKFEGGGGLTHEGNQYITRILEENYLPSYLWTQPEMRFSPATPIGCLWGLAWDGKRFSEPPPPAGNPPLPSTRPAGQCHSRRCLRLSSASSPLRRLPALLKCSLQRLLLTQ